MAAMPDFGSARSRGPSAIERDVGLLFLTRAIRMFGYGLLSVVLVLYLTALGLSAAEVGLLLALTLLGDAGVSLWLTTHADRIGRRRTLVLGAVLMLAAGVAFVATPLYAVLLVAATIGVISPSGNEVGPFLAVEQAALSQIVVRPDRRTTIFARYQLVGSFATATGALAGGGMAQAAIDAGASAADAYRLVIVVYALAGVGLACLFHGWWCWLARKDSNLRSPDPESNARIRPREPSRERGGQSSLSDSGMNQAHIPGLVRRIS
jgi:MFS family permease